MSKGSGVDGTRAPWLMPALHGAGRQHLKMSPCWPPQPSPCLLPSSLLLSFSFVLAVSSFWCLQDLSLQEALLVISSMVLSVPGVLVGNPQGSASPILLVPASTPQPEPLRHSPHHLALSWAPGKALLRFTDGCNL